MIQRSLVDNQTLYRTLPDGTTESAGPMDGEKFFKLDEILNKQLNIASENKFAQDDYIQKLHNLQVGVDAGRISSTNVPTLIAPEYKSVDDFGNETSKPWNPTLPGLKFPEITKTSTSAIPVDPSQPIVDNTVLLAWLKRIYSAVAPK